MNLLTPPRRVEPFPGDTREYRHLRQLMVDRYISARGISDPRILEAMAAVPRHLFVPPALAAKAYGDSPLPIGQKQTISQPWIVARMVELLELRGNEKVLEVGTGTGYQACVLSRVAARVYTIERISELAMKALELVRRLQINNVSVKVFDGTYGWSDQAPFDRIIVAAAGPEIPEPLVQQLARGGRMIIPVGPEKNQRLARVQRIGTRLQIEDCGSVEFVPLVGRFGWKEK
jgi:protein-L-isoaspartate(D-aspartate) O-methyltransferase